MTRLASAYQVGDYVPLARKGQFNNMRTHWHDAIGRHCPRFGINREARVCRGGRHGTSPRPHFPPLIPSSPLPLSLKYLCLIPLSRRNEYAEVDVTAGLLVLFASSKHVLSYCPSFAASPPCLSSPASLPLPLLPCPSSAASPPLHTIPNLPNLSSKDKLAKFMNEQMAESAAAVAGLPGVTEQWFEKRKEAVAAAAAAVSGGKRGAVAAATAAAAAAAAATAAAGDIAAGGDVGGGAAGGGLTGGGAPIAAGGWLIYECLAAAAVAASRAGATGAGIIGAGVQGSGVLDPSRPLIRRVEAKPVVVAHRGTGVGVKDKGKGVVGEDEKEEEEEEEEWEEVDEDEAAALLAEGGEEVDEGEEGEEGGEEGEGSKGEEGKEGEEGEAKGKGEGEGVGEWDVSRCFFCDKKNKGGVDECVEHMHRHHGFFIPDMEFLTDLQGMLQYLAAKVTQGRMCLWCDDRSKQFSSVEAVRAHMEAKSHAKLRYGDGSGVAEEELEDFYDFSTSRELIVADDTRPHVALTSGGMELIIFNAAAGKAGSRGADKGACGTKRVIGSRDLARYYRQKPKPTGDSNTRLVASVLARYRAMGLATRQLGWRTAEQQQQLKQESSHVFYSNFPFPLPVLQISSHGAGNAAAGVADRRAAATDEAEGCNGKGPGELLVTTAMEAAGGLGGIAAVSRVVENSYFIQAAEAAKGVGGNTASVGGAADV
ncbi:unnamed protein product [Closterium sp. NIES-54]